MRILIAILLICWGCVQSARGDVYLPYPIPNPPVCHGVPTVPLCAIPCGWVPVRQWCERDCYGRIVTYTTWGPPPCRQQVIFIIGW